MGVFRGDLQRQHLLAVQLLQTLEDGDFVREALLACSHIYVKTFRIDSPGLSTYRKVVYCCCSRHPPCRSKSHTCDDRQQRQTRQILAKNAPIRSQMEIYLKKQIESCQLTEGPRPNTRRTFRLRLSHWDYPHTLQLLR